MHLPVKRVETETVITHVAIVRGQPGRLHLSAGPRRQSHRETRHSRTAESCHRDRRREKHAWPYSVDRYKISTLLTGVIRNTFVVRY